MASNRYVALLRGINVGGRNIISMADLRGAFEAAGYGAVRTYIQSGNVLFESDSPSGALEDDLERVLERRFGMPLVGLVRSMAQLRAIVTKAPDGFGTQPDTYHSDVIFLKAPLTTVGAMGALNPREGVDQVWAGRGVLYFARRSELRTQSRLSRITGTPQYQQMTIRTWTTTTKLLDLLDEQPST
ncbi:MAG TPA: DUF1697 domain-containing protein [Acidimicrobiales bacterium]|nr:DUF1697 domain-containing protein [Acidimicrobiales bacterium]